MSKFNEHDLIELSTERKLNEFLESVDISPKGFNDSIDEYSQVLVCYETEELIVYSWLRKQQKYQFITQKTTVPKELRLRIDKIIGLNPVLVNKIIKEKIEKLYGRTY